MRCSALSRIEHVFRQLRLVPSVGGAYQVAGDALQSVYVGAAALRAHFQMLVGILVAAVHAAVAGMVHTSVADVVLVHHIYDAHYSLGVVGSIAVYLHVEDVSAACEIVVGSLHLCLVQGCAVLTSSPLK